VAEERLQTDILIIGGGAAGLNAALSAREAGREVVIMDKAVIERSGHFAGGIDHFAAYLDTGPSWDTREAYLDFTARSARGATNLEVVEKVYCDQLQTAIKRFRCAGRTTPSSEPNPTANPAPGGLISMANDSNPCWDKPYARPAAGYWTGWSRPIF
jgi:succinate dehydrogenase/fumarate reductase flavoprotein subunit